MKSILFIDNIFIFIHQKNWGLGIGDWGWAQSPIPNPQSPIPNPHPIKLCVRWGVQIFFYVYLKYTKKLEYNILYLINNLYKCRGRYFE